MRYISILTTFCLLLIPCMSGSAEGAIPDGIYELTSTLRGRAVLEVTDLPVVLKWKMLGADITGNGDQVISGYFYADPDDFAYGSQYNPELFVKIYIDINGWCNIAFNHVTVDPVSIYSEHHRGAVTVHTQTGSATLSHRLIEHQYDDVDIDSNLTALEAPTEICNTFTSDLWAEAFIQISPTVSKKMMWRMVGSDIVPGGDQVISGYFYGRPSIASDFSYYNPELFVKIYISKNGWTNIAFNHVTIYDVEIFSAHHYTGQADQSGTISLNDRLLEHQYEGVCFSVGPKKYDITVSVKGNGSVFQSLFGGAENSSDCVISVPKGGSQTYHFQPGSNYYTKDIIVDGLSITDGTCSDYYTCDDISKPTELEVVFGKRFTGGNPLGGLNASDVYVAGHYAYVANVENGLSIVDISSPEKSTVTSWVDTAGEAMGISVKDNYAYVADGYAGLSIIDISDATNPVIAGELYLPGKSIDIDFSDGLAYVKDDDGGLTVLYMTDPVKPVVDARIDSLGAGSEVCVGGKYAYYAGEEAFQVVDIADPSNPVLVGRADTGSSNKIAVNGNYAYLASSWGEDAFQVIDISDPDQPSVVGSVGWYSTHIVDLSVFGDYAYVTFGYEYRNGISPLRVIDVSDPTNPLLAGEIDLSGHVHVSGGYLYLADGNLHVVNNANPSSMALIDSIGNSGPRSLCSVGNYLYVLKDGRLLVLDISDANNPEMVEGDNNNFSEPYVEYLAYVSDTYMYGFSSLLGSVVIDITDPINPISTQLLNLYKAREVCVSGPFAYVATGLDFSIYSVIDPRSPVLVGRVDMNQATDVAVYGEYVFVGERGAGLHVVDISDHTDPVVVWSRSHEYEFFTDIGVSGSYAYVFFGNTLEVWNIIDPTNPVVVDVKSWNAWTNIIQISNDYMYVADSNSFQVINIADPLNTIAIETLHKPAHYLESSIESVHVSGNYAYIGDEHDGLTVVDLDVCGLK